MNTKIEILTTEEFYARMKIGRTTFFEWKRKGRLKAGRDFIQEGRVIRIFWSEELINRLLQSSAESDCPKSSGKPKAETVRPPRRKSAVNFAY
ncbi:MAG: hypothetical protein ABFD98_08265 [Syntrophobacteraceae bacterium]